MIEENMPPPTKTGAYGRAWLCDHAATRAALNLRADQDATLQSWIVEARWAHPFWHSYWIALQHLKSMPGLPDALINRPGATHEFHVLAYNPEKPRDAAVLGKDRPQFLMPPNFAGQLIEPTDAAAITKVEGAVDLILSGELNPDTDAMRQWVAIFGDAMLKRGR